MSHDPFCTLHHLPDSHQRCSCIEIRHIRADERERAAQRVAATLAGLRLRDWHITRRTIAAARGDDSHE